MRGSPSGLLVAAVAAAVPCVWGDLRTAPPQRTVDDGPGSSDALVVPLRRVRVRSPHREMTAQNRVSLYIGDISVGQPPQDFEVTFDTASGHVLLPHAACTSATCKAHELYTPWESSTAEDINLNGTAVMAGRRLARGNGLRDFAVVGYTQSDLGAGNVTAVLVRDSVCVTPEACVDMGVLAAKRMTEEPFAAAPNDGVVGLGLDGLAFGTTFNLLSRLFQGRAPARPQFGIALGEEGGEVRFGDLSGAPIADRLRWLPVDHPETGFWQVAIQAVRVGDTVVHDCSRGCHGIVDTGVSHLGAQKSHVAELVEALAPARAQSGSCHGPLLTFDLDGYSLTLEAEDYTDEECSPQVGSLDLDEPPFTGVFALGAGVLRRYYAAFDWEQRKLAFAPVVSSAASMRKSMVMV